MTEQEQEEFVRNILDELDREEAVKMADVQPGFLVRYTGEDKRFTFSELRVLTQGRVYRVGEVHRERKTVLTNSDIEGERGWLGPFNFEIIGEGPVPLQTRPIHDFASAEEALTPHERSVLKLAAGLPPGAWLLLGKGVESEGVARARKLDDLGFAVLKSTEKGVSIRLTSGGKALAKTL